MKFKKVEIQGFRAYGNKEDATFDFTVNNDVVDLISIYAPNGFGKTSFYDAIEWTLTNKIKRIDSALDNYDLIKTEKDANREGNQQSEALHIISKKGYNNPEKFINIETTKENFHRKINNADRKGTVDYDRKAELENSSFRDVILSQEGISSFLVAEKPEGRYKNFVQHFDSSDLDRIYRNLVALKKENEKRHKALRNDKTKIKKQLNKKIDVEIFEKINKLILELDSLEFKLGEISKEFDLSDLAIFKSNITGVKNEIELGESSILEQLKKERNLLVDIQKNSSKYASNIEQKKKLIKLITNITDRIKDFTKLEKKNNEKDKLLVRLKQCKKEKDDFNFLSEQLLNIQKKSKRLDQINNDQKQKKDYLVRLNNLEKLINLNLAFFESRKFSNEEKITKIKQDIDVKKSNLKKYENSLKEVSKIETNLKPKKDELKIENDALKKLKKEIEKILLIEKNLKSGIYENDNSNLINNTSTDVLRNLKLSISNKEKEISLVKKKLNESKSFQENLSYLIELGKKIVDNTKQSNCPLCKNEYGDYKSLLEKINLNNLLQESSKEKTDRLNQLELELKDLKQELEKNVESLKAIITAKIEELQIKINKSSNKIETYKKDMSSSEKDLENHKSIIENHKNEYQKINLEKRFSELQKEVENLKNKINIHEKNVEKYISWIDRIKEKQSKSNIAIHDLDKNLLSLISDPIYKKFIDLLGLYDLDSTKPEIEAKFKKLKKELENLDKEILNLNQDINSLKSNLKEFRVEDLKSQESMYKKELIELSSFESEFSNLIDSLNINKKNIAEDLTLKTSENKEAINKSEKALRVLSKIEKLVEPLGEFLNYNQLKREEKDLDAKIVMNGKIDGDLKDELENISNRIDLMIKNFFFDDLINKIYTKIDPHPEYKEIKFAVDFTDYGAPKLNIFTENETGSGKRVPNLYFSTAQMNVLSLSIFLAKALHAVDKKGNQIDTIFIDDPVQSMDSINVLSVIDLLRNIITNHKKQIVISTHDENFFNLLKKKIPKTHYKSKFLELETFGKLKAEIKSKNDSSFQLNERTVIEIIKPNEDLDIDNLGNIRNKPDDDMLEMGDEDMLTI